MLDEIDSLRARLSVAEQATRRAEEDADQLADMVRASIPDQWINERASVLEQHDRLVTARSQPSPDGVREGYPADNPHDVNAARSQPAPGYGDVAAVDPPGDMYGITQEFGAVPDSQDPAKATPNPRPAPDRPQWKMPPVFDDDLPAVSAHEETPAEPKCEPDCEWCARAARSEETPAPKYPVDGWGNPIGSPDVDDMLAFLAPAFHVSIEAGSSSGWELWLSNEEEEHEFSAPTLKAALEAAVRAVAETGETP